MLPVNAIVTPNTYTEELHTGLIPAARYADIARQAAAALGWRNTPSIAPELRFQTPPSHLSPGELIVLQVREGSATFTSHALHDHYWTGSQHEINAGRFKSAVQAVLAQNKLEERKLSYARSEKYGALVPSKTYLVTPLLVYANALMLLLMVLAGVSPLAPKAQTLLQWGGSFRPAILAGEYWRLLTAMFLHGGIIHLAGNTFALLYVGMYLEPLMGRTRYLTAYIMTGVCGSLMSIAMHGNSVGVGASGAIFGLYGVFLALLTTRHVERTVRKTMLRSILFFVVYNLLYGLQGNTDNAAHMGGLLSGLLIGFAYYPGIKAEWTAGKQVALSAGIVVAVAGICATVITLLVK